MAIDSEALLQAICVVCDEKGLKAAISETLKGGIATGICAILGGLILGPAGLALGGGIGGMVSAVATNGKFQPVSQIIKKMDTNKKEFLYKKLQKAFSNVGVEDLAAIIILSNGNIQDIAIKVVTEFLCKDMNYQIQS